MRRDLARLGADGFDVLVIGAGIYGVATAWDAVQRGLSVALIDRGDIGGGTSFNNLKTVHGGLRSVQQGNVREMREFIRERRTWGRILPHLIHPLPFVVPTYRTPSRSRAALRAALTLHNLVSFDRNDNPDPSKHLPAGRVISRAACLDHGGGLSPEGITGGALWYDCQMYNTDRVTLAFARSAADAGACVANYVEARRFLLSGPRVIGVEATDVLDGRDFEIRADLVVNAAGPWANDLLARLPGAPVHLAAARLSKAMNVVTRRVPASAAVGGVARGRFLFMIPWREFSLVGTSHEPYAGEPDGLAVTRADIDGFMRDVQVAFPGAGLTTADVRLVHRGLLPMVGSRGDEVRLLKASQIRDHRLDGAPGLMSVLGVRYTTARHTAERAVDVAVGVLGRATQRSRTAVTPLAGGAIDDFDDFLATAIASPRPAGVGPAVIDRLVRSYGSEYARLLDTMAARPNDAVPLGRACPVTSAEIRHAVRHEMAVTLSDAVLRRTEAGSAGHPGADAVNVAADVVRDELGWTDERRRDEIARLERVYWIADGRTDAPAGEV